LQGGGDLAWNYPERVSRALGQLRQHLEILIGEQFGVGVVAVHGLKYLVDSAGLALGLEDRCGPVALGAQDGGLLVTLGGEDLRLALAFGAQDCRTLVALGPHLLLHRVLDGLRRVPASASPSRP